MNTKAKDFRVGEGDMVDLDAWLTKVDPVSKSKGQYKKIAPDHVGAAQRATRLHYASNYAAC